VTLNSQSDDLRATILTPETVQKIISILENPDQGVRKSAVKTMAALVEYSEFFTLSYTAWK
jgi:HEAT repeat protein